MTQNNECINKKDNHSINSWEELNIKSEILRGIYANGFENPSPIQRKAIIPMINKNDRCRKRKTCLFCSPFCPGFHSFLS